MRSIVPLQAAVACICIKRKSAGEFQRQDIPGLFEGWQHIVIFLVVAAVGRRKIHKKKNPSVYITLGIPSVATSTHYVTVKSASRRQSLPRI